MACAANTGAEEVALGVALDLRAGEVGVQVFIERVVGGHVVLLAALLMQANPRATALDVDILDLHFRDGSDTAKGVDHERDQRTVAQADGRAGVDGIQQSASLVGGQHRRLALLDRVPGPAHGTGRVGFEHLANHKPVEQHPQSCEVDLDRGRCQAGAQGLDVGRDVHRLDVLQVAEAVLFPPGGEGLHGAGIGPARVRVADVGGEELDEALRGLGVGREEPRQRQVGGLEDVWTGRCELVWHEVPSP